MRKPKDTQYEVQVAEGGRWTLDSVHPVKAEAVKRAKTLVAANKGDSVRVQEETWRYKPKTVFEEACAGRPEKQLSIAGIDEAPPCAEPEDFYAYPARLTLDRLLRPYLDQEGLTALELLHDRYRLADLARQEPLLNQAVHRVATLQARAAGREPQERVDELYRVLGQLRSRAQEAPDPARDAERLAAKGLAALPDDPPWRRRAAVAALLDGQRDWLRKADLLLDLLGLDLPGDGPGLLDEALAEVLDGTSAIRDLLGGQRDLAAALATLAGLATGTAGRFRDSESTAARLNRAMGAHDLARTREVLLQRVARELDGLQPLTKEDTTADRKAFAELVRGLAAPAGLAGGSVVSRAVTRRARVVFGSADGDLTLEEAVRQVQMLLPNNAVRLGYLLDLGASALDKNQRGAVLKALLALVQGIVGFDDLVGAATDTETRRRVLHDLEPRVAGSLLPAEAAQLLSTKLAALQKETGLNVAEQAAPAPPQGGDSAGGLPRRRVAAGQLLFHQGDQGDEAYVVLSGEIEVLHRNEAGRERVIAIRERGQILGEMALIDDQPRMASARAASDSELAVLPRAAFKQRLDRLGEEDHIIRWLLETFVARLRAGVED